MSMSWDEDEPQIYRGCYCGATIIRWSSSDDWNRTREYFTYECPDTCPDKGKNICEMVKYHGCTCKGESFTNPYILRVKNDRKELL